MDLPVSIISHCTGGCAYKTMLHLKCFFQPHLKLLRYSTKRYGTTDLRKRSEVEHSSAKMCFSLEQRRGHERNHSGGSQKERMTPFERARRRGICRGTYLFFVTSFSSHCRALKHKEIIKTCIWEALGFMFKICKCSRAEHSNKWAPALLQGLVLRELCPFPGHWSLLSAWRAAPSAGLPVHAAPTPSFSHPLCCHFPGSRPPAGNEKARPSLNAGSKPCSPPCINCQKWLVLRSSQVKQWPLRHQVPFVRHYVLQMWARPHPLTALPPVLEFLLTRYECNFCAYSLPPLLWDPFKHTHSLAPLLGRALSGAQRCKVEENTVLHLGNFSSTALVFKTTPQGSGTVHDDPGPHSDADRGALGQSSSRDIFLCLWKILKQGEKKKSRSKRPVNS